MTVRELIDKLEKLEPTKQVLIPLGDGEEFTNILEVIHDNGAIVIA